MAVEHVVVEAAGERAEDGDADLQEGERQKGAAGNEARAQLSAEVAPDR